jgi:predicted methyltransferase
MTALDVIGVAGWYTGILSAAVGPTGHVYSQNPTFIVEREGFVQGETERHAELGNVEALHGDVAGIDSQIDIAISNQNMHDIFGGGEDAALALVSSIYNALKPGGVFGLMDHRGIAGQPNVELHRMEVDSARDLLVKAGFDVEADSSLLAYAADDHTLGSADESLNGMSDRFLLKARKPR